MSPIDICNQALAHIGDRRITRLDDEAQATDPLVRFCSEFYESARTEALAAHRWSFAKGAEVLVRRTDTPVIGRFTYTHIKPVGCLRVMQLIKGYLSGDEVTPSSYRGNIDSFEIVGKDIKSNYQFLALEYIKDVTDPSDWSPHFRAAVSRLLAHYLAGAIADNPGLASQQLDIYEKVALTNAQYYDAVQDNSGENSDQTVRKAGSPLYRSRFASGYDDNGPIDASE